LIISIPKEGHDNPVLMEGEELTWKKTQKKEKNNKTSLKTNVKNPIFKLCFTKDT
jgi:hypothetical protein